MATLNGVGKLAILVAVFTNVTAIFHITNMNLVI